MSIKDRGTIKWGALMLPEHLQKLKEWRKEAYAEAPRSLTDWELDDLQETINQAVNQLQVITLTVWEKTRYVQWTGTIQKLDSDKRELELQTITSLKRLSINDIHAAKLDEEY